jgi:hypothetical protein
VVVLLDRKAFPESCISSRWFRRLSFTRSTPVCTDSSAALVSTLGTLLTIVIPALLLSAALTSELRSIHRSLSASGAGDGGLITRVLQLLGTPQMWLGEYIDLSQADLHAELSDRLQQASSFLLSHLPVLPMMPLSGHWPSSWHSGRTRAIPVWSWPLCTRSVGRS